MYPGYGDPRYFEGFGGPVPSQELAPGFRAPPLLDMTPAMQAPPQQQQSGGGMPGMPPGLSSMIPGMGGAAASGAGPAGSTAVGGGAPALEAIMGGPGAAATPAASGGGSAGGLFGGAGGAGGLAALAPFAYAAAIGVGKNTEANHANTPFGDVLLGGLAPSGAQMLKDPLGMGLPTLLGMPFLTPFTASKEAKAEKPEWSGLFGLGF